MADKLSWTDLRRALAQRAGVSEKDANVFLNALNAQVVEALKADKQVKINGLGAFKLQAVAPRKSVNVTTGEEIIIPGYNKIAFAPEAGVKELVEKTSGISVQPSEASLQTPEIDPLKKLGEQAEEIVGLLGDLGQSPREAEPVVVEPEKPVEPEPIAEEPEPVVEELERPAEPEPVIEEPKPVEPEPVKPEPFVFGAPKKEEPKKKEKKYHFFRDTLICVIILLILLVVGYFLLRNHLSQWITEWMTREPSQTEVVAPVADTTAVEEAVEPLSEEEIMTREQITAEFLAISGEAEDAETPDDILYEELITIEPMHEASRLTWMAKRYYGSKAYWPYLYDANKDHIDNPNAIEVGTPIRVPKLTKAQRDTTSADYQRLRQAAERAAGK